MKTREQYAARAQRLADQAHHYTYGDGADVVTGAALAAEGQIYATLATVAPASTAVLAGPVADELDALRSAVAAFLNDAVTSADHQAPDVIANFRGELENSPYGAPVLALARDLAADMADELDETDEAALDATAEDGESR